MTGLHMESAGVPPERVARLLERADHAEIYVAQTYGGTLRQERDRLGDVDIPGIGTVNVKSVDVGYRWVNGGKRESRPIVPVIVVEWDGPTPRIAGWVAVGSWEWRRPRTANAVECWYVSWQELRDELPAWELLP